LRYKGFGDYWLTELPEIIVSSARRGVGKSTGWERGWRSLLNRVASRKRTVGMSHACLEGYKGGGELMGQVNGLGNIGL